MADKTYRLNVTLTDGSQQSAGTFTVPQGEPGAQGPKGDPGAQGPQGVGVRSLSIEEVT